MSRGGPLDIAIVGIGCDSPGAPDLSAYWQGVLAGREVPLEPGADGPGSIAAAAAALADAGLGVVCSTPMPLRRAIETLSAREVDLAVAGDETIAAALVLKRRADAERDGDRIYALLPARTDAADLPEIPATGVPGLIQGALALHHRVRPPDLHAARPWIHADASAPRRVRVADVVLEEHAASADADPLPDRDHSGAVLHRETEAILLSAPDRDGLANRARELIAWLEGHPDAALEDVAFTLNGIDPVEDGERLGLVATSTADLAARLSAVLARLEDPRSPSVGDGRGIYHWDEPLGGAGGLAFLFPGEGSQYPGMLADLCLHFPEVRRQFDTADRIAIEQGDAVTPSEQLFGDAEGNAALWSAPTAVNLILNAQWALYQVLTRLGLRPDAVAGHSSGEILALAAAGVLRTDSELERQLGRLGAIFRGLETSGDMPAARLVAVAADRARAEAACRAAGAAGVAVAIDNCPHQVVLAGPPAEVDRVVAHLRAGNVLVDVLPFDRAYHTDDFAAVIGPIADSFAGLTFRSPRLPVYSCATRERMPADPEAIRSLAIAQWTRTVAFRETVEAMHADGLRVFVDVGARGNLAGFVQDTLRGRPAFAIAANLPRRGGLTQLNHLVAALFAQGIPIRTDFLYARRRPRRIGWQPSASRAPALAAVASSLEDDERRSAPGPPPESRLREESGWGGRTDDGSISPESRLPAESGWGGRLKPVLQLPRSIDDPRDSSDVDATMLAFQETMRAFLETQHAVLAAYLGADRPDADAEISSIQPAPAATASGPEPGPWAGEVRRLVPGSEVQSVYILDVRTDPIAEHHTLGGRRVSAIDPTLKGLPVLPFAVMAEMAAQAAALVVPPGLVLLKLTHVYAHKWVRYEEEPVVVELRGLREPSPDPGEECVRVALYNRGPGGRSEAPRPVFEAVAVFGDRTPDPPPASPWALEDARPSRFTADSIYEEQWLFHGPAFQAVSGLGAISAAGIDGTLRVLPWEPLVRPGRPTPLHSDVIVLDSFTHILGCWGLDEHADRGDVVFPLRMEELALFGDRPEVGTDVACRIAILEVHRHRLRVLAEIVRPDGTVWMRIGPWEDWRFHWPGRYRDVFRQPRDHLVGEELPLPDPSIRAVWLAPPGDMGRPVWRDVLEHTQLGPAERAEHLALGGSEDIRSRRLWGRIAAKEAARRLWRDAGRAPTYPADLAVVPDEPGRPRLVRLDDPGDRSLPAIAIADAEGVAVAIAAGDPRARPGLAVAAIPDRPAGEELFTPDERAMLAHWTGPARSEWSSRFRCAREAALGSAGMGIADAPTAAEVVRLDAATGDLLVRCAATGANPILVKTARRGEYAWAWTLGGGVDP